MKKCFVYLLLAVLSFLSAYGLFACRSVKKSRSSADSTIVRSAGQSQSWQTESVQEIVIESDDLSFVQPGQALPPLYNMTGPVPTGLKKKLGLWGPDSNQVKARPPSTKKGTRLIFRKVTRQSSELRSELHEHKQVSADLVAKSRQPTASSTLSIVLAVVVIIIVGAILYRSKRGD